SSPTCPRPRASRRRLKHRLHDELLLVNDLRQAHKTSERLTKMGMVALPFLLQGAEHHDKQVHMLCHIQLREYFPEEPAFIDLLIKTLENKDEDPEYRWASIIHLRE